MNLRDLEYLVALAHASAIRTSPYGYWLYQADTQPRQDVLDVIEWIRSEARAVEVVVNEALVAQAGA